MASQRRAPAGARHSLWGMLVPVAALFMCFLGWPVDAEVVVQSARSSPLNGTCLSNGASFYKSCWPVVLAHNAAARSAYEALFPNSTAVHAHRDMLRELNITADMLVELPSEQCCADAETFFGAAFQETCVDDPSIRPQLYGYTRDEIDAVAAFFGGLCGFAPAASTWPNTERSFVTESPVGGRRLLQNCYQTDSTPGPYCPSGYGHCNGNTCTFGTGACSADLTVCTCYYLNQCSCFPGDAHVETPDGRHVALRDLRVGDRVKAALPGGGFGFEEVYMFGHRDAVATAVFVSVELAPLPGRNGSVAATLRLTRDHFVPIVPEGLEPVWANHVQTRGKDVRPGQVAFADVAGRMVPCLVASVAVTKDIGLYNPYTMNGLIVVDGVLASAHSSWILDGLFDTMGLTRHLPAAYQALFAPIRALYLLVGPAAFSAALNAVGVERWGSALGAGAIRFDTSSVAAATTLPLLVAAAYKGSAKWRQAA